MSNNSPTSKDILDISNRIYDVANRIEDKFDRKFEDIDDRVGVLENGWSRLMGIMGIISVVASAVFSWIWERVTKNI